MKVRRGKEKKGEGLDPTHFFFFFDLSLAGS